MLLCVRQYYFFFPFAKVVISVRVIFCMLYVAYLSIVAPMVVLTIIYEVSVI